MRRLVESWIAAELEDHGNNVAGAIRDLRENIGKAATHSRVSEWRRGVYVPSQEVLSWMLYRTLPWALRASGIALTEDQREKLNERIWRTYLKGGESWFDLV